jgi:predicted Rossmann fold flavoprotein
MEQKKLIVIGGGAAGFFAAINAAEKFPELSVQLVEKSSKVLSKVKVSGGGRCNVTNANKDISSLAKNYPRGEKELRKAFHRFNTAHTIQWFESRGVKLKAEPDGRVFPVTDNSQTIIDCFLDSCASAGVKISYNTSIKSFNKNGKRFSLATDNGNTLECDFVIIATGGNPREDAYNWIKNNGHKIETPVPSLFTFNINDKSLNDLKGVSIKNGLVKIAGTKLISTGPILITHWGLSGPAILKLSAFGAKILHEKNYNYTVLVNWTEESTETDVKNKMDSFKITHPKKQILSGSPFHLPLRLWEFLTEKAQINKDNKWDVLPKKNLNRLVNNLYCDQYEACGKTTFKEEFVTCGGVSLNDINFTSMESKAVPGLFFCGEVIDVDGVTGGYNFQAAWTTAWLATEGLGEYLKNI